MVNGGFNERNPSSGARVELVTNYERQQRIVSTCVRHEENDRTHAKEKGAFFASELVFEYLPKPFDDRMCPMIAALIRHIGSE
jgi:hypothetical protein